MAVKLRSLSLYENVGSVEPKESKVLSVVKEEFDIDINSENDISIYDKIKNESGEYSCENCKYQSVKTETSDGVKADEESIYINQITDQSSIIWTQEDSSTAGSGHLVKMEKNEDYSNEAEYTNNENIQETNGKMCSKPSNHLTQHNDLKTNLDSTQTKSKKFNCDFCNYSSRQRWNMLLHTESVHLKVKNHKWNELLNTWLTLFLLDGSEESQPNSTYKPWATANFNTGHEERSPSVLPNCVEWYTILVRCSQAFKHYFNSFCILRTNKKYN